MFKRIFILILLFPCLVRAERVRTDTEIYSEPGRESLAMLMKGSGFYADKEEKGYLKIIATVWIDKAAFDNVHLTIEKKTTLYDAAGQITGKIYGKMKLTGGYSLDSERVGIELVGYILKEQSDTNWVVERNLSRLIDSAGSKIDFSALTNELGKFQYKKVKDENGFAAYQFTDIKGLQKNNPVERLKLVFYENRLVAIFHKKPMFLKTKEVIVVDGKDNLIYLRDLDAAEKKEFARLFLDG